MSDTTEVTKHEWRISWCCCILLLEYIVILFRWRVPDIFVSRHKSWDWIFSFTYSMTLELAYAWYCRSGYKKVETRLSLSFLRKIATVMYITGFMNKLNGLDEKSLGSFRGYTIIYYTYFPCAWNSTKVILEWVLRLLGDTNGAYFLTEWRLFISTGNLISLPQFKILHQYTEEILSSCLCLPWKQNFSSVKMSQGVGWESEKRVLVSQCAHVL